MVPISDDALLAEDDSLLMDDMDGDFSDDKMEEDIDLDAIEIGRASCRERVYHCV